MKTTQIWWKTPTYKIQDAKAAPSKINIKKTTSGHILVKLMKVMWLMEKNKIPLCCFHNNPLVMAQ